MRHFAHVLGFGGLIAVLVALAPSEVNAEKKKNQKKDMKEYPVAVDADYTALRKQKEVTGKLVSIDGVTITIRAEYPYWEANPKYKPPKAGAGGNPLANQQAQMYRTYNDLMRKQQQAMTAKTPQEYQRAMQGIMQDMNRLQQEIMRMNQQMAKAAAAGQKIDPNNQPFVQKNNTKDFDLELLEKVVYRKMVLPFEYDDIGNVKTYSEKEKAELRGEDKTKPGYIAKIEDFMPGQEIKLYLSAPKKKPVEKDAPKEKDKDADKDKEKDKEAKAPDEVPRPTVNMVVLTKDVNSTASPGDPKKKGK